MKRLVLEKLCLMMIFIVFYFIVEIITFEWLGLAFLPNFLFVDFLVVLMLSSVALLFKSNKLSIAYLSFLLVIILILSFTNQTLNLELNGEVFTLEYFNYVDEAANVFLVEFIHFDALTILLSIGVFYAITVNMVSKVFFHPYMHEARYYKQALIIFLATLLAFMTLFNIGIPSLRNYGRIININLFKKDTIEEYGLIGFYYKDVDIMFFDAGYDNYNLEDLEEDFIYHNPMTGDESDLEIPYSGLLEGKNIITIMVESGQSFAINEFLTPNLYKLSKEGLFFPNHYSENKTNVAEIIGILGSNPSKRINTDKFNYDFDFSLPNILNDLGYHTAYFHENLGYFYNREDIIPSFGFDDVYLHDDLFPEEPIYGWGGDYTLDSRTMDRMLDFMFEGDDPFYYFWSTLVGHGPYNTNYSSSRGKNNIAKFSSLGYFDLIDIAKSRGDWVNLLDDSDDKKDPGRFRFYQAAMMDYDRAIGKLLDRLEEEDLLEETVILMYGDHNLYYHQMHLRLNGIEAGNISHTDAYKTMFLIYNPSLTNAYLTNNNTLNTSLNKFITPYDILPTYYHLLGISHYDNFVIGESILSDESTVYYSHKISAFFNDDYFSYNNNSIYFPSNVDLERNPDASEFILKNKNLSEKLIWIDLWVGLSKTKK